MLAPPAFPTHATARARGLRPIAAGDLPSLRDWPCAYPDARPPADRLPYGFSQGRVLPLVRSGEATPAVLDGGGGLPLDDWLFAIGEPPMRERVALLAVGSNAYPRQLFDKFRGAALRDDSVVTLPCLLKGAAVAFAAQLSAPGYIPVSLRAAPGGITRTWIQYVTPEQLECIAASEGENYRLVECVGGGVAIRVEGLVAPPERVYGWLHRRLLGLDFGSGPEPLDAARHNEATLLRRLVREVNAAEEWDGCRIPVALRAGLQSVLCEHALVNAAPSSWRVVERAAPGFAAGLVV